MNILQTTTIDNITISVGDIWDIGNNIQVELKELFEIENQIYMSIITHNQSMMGFKIDKDDIELITPNRYINLAEIWVKKNSKLFIS